jgi:predicted PurR-regulated permease PerM
MKFMPRKVEISHRTIVFTVFFLVFLWVLYFIRDIILEFFLAILIMAVLDPFVTKLQEYKIPRGASVLIAYLFLIMLLGLSIAAIIPSLLEQTSSFINNLPRFLDSLGISSKVSEQIIQQVLGQIGSLPAKLVNTTFLLFSNFLGVVAVLVFAFYLLSERDDLKEQIIYWMGEKRGMAVEKNFKKVEEKLGGWARGELSLMFAVGFANYIGLRLLGIPFALPLAILAGTLEIVPYIGPVLAAVPATLIGFGISPVIGWAVAAMAFLVQQLENHVLVPKIMQKQTGINPIITLLVLAIGARLAGLLGLLISVPVYITMQVITRQYFVSEDDTSVQE